MKIESSKDESIKEKLSNLYCYLISFIPYFILFTLHLVNNLSVNLFDPKFSSIQFP